MIRQSRGQVAVVAEVIAYLAIDRNDRALVIDFGGGHTVLIDETNCSVGTRGGRCFVRDKS